MLVYKSNKQFYRVQNKIYKKNIKFKKKSK